VESAWIKAWHHGGSKCVCVCVCLHVCELTCVVYEHMCLMQRCLHVCLYGLYYAQCCLLAIDDIVVDQIFLFFLFWWVWTLNSVSNWTQFELYTYKACTPPVEPCLQSICSAYFGDRVSETICSGWHWATILPISGSPIARIIGMSHQCLDFFVFSKHLIDKVILFVLMAPCVLLACVCHANLLKGLYCKNVVRPGVVVHTCNPHT
jgi:hypothetical protein